MTDDKNNDDKNDDPKTVVYGYRGQGSAASVDPVGFRGSVSAVSSVSNIARYVVGDDATAAAIRQAVFILDAHDLTAVKNKAIPQHVQIPNNEESHALAASYAEAELYERRYKRDKRTSWWKEWGGWIVAVVVALIGLIAALVK